MEKIIIASDHVGYALKEKLKLYLEQNGFKIKDLGAHSPESCDYPVFAADLAAAIAGKKFKRGILICKTGIGNSIVANRFPGVRASLCYNRETAKLTREHNDSNVLVLGSGFTKAPLAEKILDVWLSTKFAGGRHRRRLNQIKNIERQIGVCNGIFKRN